jgi:hypothetical protein
MFSNFFFFENRAVYEIMLKKYCRTGQVTRDEWRMCIVCWIPKSTYTHSEYVIHIAVELEQ